MSRDPSRPRGLPVALVLSAAAGLLFAPAASRAGLAVVIVVALWGGWTGAATARSRARAWVVPGACVLVASLGPLAASLLDRLPPALVPWPELLAHGREAVVLGLPTFAAAWLVAHAAARVPAMRLLPVAALVGAAALLFAPHRGGAIHLPYAVSDRAFVAGWHPALVFSALGVIAGVAGSLALYRPGRARRVWLSALLLLLAAVTLVRFAPGLGLLRLPSEDPLRLAGDPQGERGGRGAGGESPRPPRGGQNPLGLTVPGSGHGERLDEMAPFRDDYSSNGAEAPVAVVVLHDDVDPSSGVFYFRQVAFSHHNGRRLVQARDAGGEGPDGDLFTGFPDPGEIDVHPLGPGAPFRDLLHATVSLVRDHVLPPVLADGFAIGSVPNADPALFRRTYDTRSMVLTAKLPRLLGRSAGAADWSKTLDAAYREAPQDPRYATLAREIDRTLRPEYAGDPWARALAVAIWLEEHTQYSLRSHHAAADDPTASFLFGDRIGYCVHLAHAAAYLLRAMGLPARVAAGYAYEASNRAGGSALLLRAGDAHAWAEIYLEGVGWVPVDPSPPSLDPPLTAPSLDLQRLLGEMARPRASGARRDAPAPYRMPGPGEALLVTGSALLAWIGLGHATKLWRRLAPRLARRDRTARLALRAGLDRLGEAGLVRAAGETREAFARRVAGVAPSIVPLTAAHLAARFGDRPADPRAAAELASRVARQRGTSPRRGARATVWWGRLDPWRWVRTR
ncbi:MAG: transglutaminase domain-containing protein [Acidobacteria bacterium]|jgi:hypothetical protein|nr:transglutaminase domain-containing protein [Acidobacteriota bacterium]